MKRPKGIRAEPTDPFAATPAPSSPSEETEPITLDETEPITFEVTEPMPLDATGPSDLDATVPIDPLVKRQERRASAQSVRDAKRQVRIAKRQRKQRERDERRRFTQHSRERRRRALILLGAVSVLALFVGVGLFTPVMSVRSIEVAGAARVPEDELQHALESLVGTPLALVSDDEVREHLTPFRLIETYAVEKIPPSTLRVVIEEREPIVAVITGDRFALLDPSGVTIDTVDAGQLADTIPVFRDAPTDATSPVFQAVGNVLRNMPDALKRQVLEISAETPQQITLILRTGERVIWGDARDTVRKATVFMAMVEALGDRSASVIDVSAPGAPVYVP